MTEHHDQLRADHPGCELEAAKHFRIDEIAGDAADEDVTYALVEDDLGWYAGVQAAHDGGKRLLAASGGLHAREVIVIERISFDGADVASLEALERLRG